MWHVGFSLKCFSCGEHRLYVHRPQWLQHMGSVVVAVRLCCCYC